MPEYQVSVQCFNFFNSLLSLRCEKPCFFPIQQQLLFLWRKIPNRATHSDCQFVCFTMVSGQGDAAVRPALFNQPRSCPAEPAHRKESLLVIRLLRMVAVFNLSTQGSCLFISQTRRAQFVPAADLIPDTMVIICSLLFSIRSSLGLHCLQGLSYHLTRSLRLKNS